MKIAILGDLHFGARGDSIVFTEYFYNFFENQFFPYCEKHDIKTVIQLGDMFDRRKFINFNTLFQIHQRFINGLTSRGITLHALIGNHDTYYKNTNKVNAFACLFENSNSINYYDDFTAINIGGKSFDFVPWINPENEEEYNEHIYKSTSDYCVGHFEITGFEMYKGVKGHDGADPAIFRKYNTVFSGHYHTRSSRGNILYCGTPYEITWSDYNDPKGFHILDTETGVVEFIKNPDTIHHKIFINEDFKAQDLVYESYNAGYVKVYIIGTPEPKEYDEFLDSIEKANPTSVDMIEQTAIQEDDDDIEVEIQDTISIVLGHIDNIEDDGIDKQFLKRCVQEVHAEALELENNGE